MYRRCVLLFKIIGIDELLKMLEGYNHAELHIHHTWRPNHEIYYNKPDGIYWQEAMKRFHVGTNGWSDIAQHVTLLPDGKFVTGRDFSRNPASIVGYNGNVFMVEMIGDFDIGQDPFDGPQKESALMLARWFDKRRKYIRFHNENSSKTCPGSSINKYDFMQAVRNNGGGYALPTLREGARGDEVRLLQEKLSLLKYNIGSIDDIYGPLTKAAVISFQKDHGLQPDGIFGSLTRDALEKTLKDQESNNPGEGDGSSPDIIEIENRLEALENQANTMLNKIMKLKEAIN